MNRDDETWSHLVELGWLKVTNLLPNTTYKVKIMRCLFAPKIAINVTHLQKIAVLSLFSVSTWQHTA